MSDLIYEEIPRLSRSEVERFVASDNEWNVITGILSASLYDEDADWATELCVGYFNHPVRDVQAAALVGISHIVRIHRALDTRKVLPLLFALKDDPSVIGRVEDVEADIELFLGDHREKQ